MDAKDRKIERLERLVAKQAAMIEKLTRRIDQLERELAAARKDSSNSSKPPSSDIVKKPMSKGGGKRKRKRKPGGQKGHIKHERPPFLPDEIDDAPKRYDQATSRNLPLMPHLLAGAVITSWQRKSSPRSPFQNQKPVKP